MNGSGGDSTHVREIILNLSKNINSITVISSTDNSNILKENNIKFIKGKFIKIPFLMSPSYFLYTFIIGFFVLLTSKCDVIYERHHIFGTGCRLAKIFRIPCIIEVNGLTTDELKMKGLVRKVIKIIESNTFSLADKIIVVTSNLKLSLQTEYNISKNKIHIIENGTNIDLFRPMDVNEIKKKLNFNLNYNYICFVGHLVYWQGLENLIQAAPLVIKACSDARFLVIGDGVMKNEWMQLARRLDVFDRFIFTGSVPYEHVPMYINASDVCVAPFITARNAKIGLSPLKIYEYLACGKPVVASSIPGVIDLLTKSKCGIAVTPENIHELSDAILKLLQDDKLGKQMGRNGKIYVVENNSWANVTKKIEHVCESIILNQIEKP